MTQPETPPAVPDDSPALDDYETLWTRLRGLLPPDAALIQRVTAAYKIARAAHTGQWRKTAQGVGRVPYIVHPLRVALVVAEEWDGRDGETLSACLLHDVLEDCAWEQRDEWEQQITEATGPEIRQAVRTLSKPASGPAEVKASRDARYFAELFKAPRWVRLVKCADRVDNLRDAARWGNREFWTRYSSETIGWHLYLARETAPIAEVALFKALVDGERALRGRVPIWADGRIIDPVAAALIPEHVARLHGVIGLALQGQTLIVGLKNPGDLEALETVRRVLPAYAVRPVKITPEALDDALNAEQFGRVGK